MKITVEEVKQDLKDIKHFYAHEELFKKALQSENVKMLVMKVTIYKEIMVSAPFELFMIYFGLYVYRQKQKELAEYLEISERTVRRKREQLYQYLIKRLRFYKDFH